MSIMITHTIINSTMENPASRFFIGDPSHSLSRHLSNIRFLSNEQNLVSCPRPSRLFRGPSGIAKFNRSTLLAKGDVGTRGTPPNANDSRPMEWLLSCSLGHFLLDWRIPRQK